MILKYQLKITEIFYDEFFHYDKVLLMIVYTFAFWLRTAA